MSEKTVDKVIAEYNRGERNPFAIAEKFGIKVKSVRDYIYRAGLNLGGRKKVYNRAAKTQFIMTDLKLGVLSMAKIAKKYGVSRQYVFQLKEELKKNNEI